MRLRRVLIFGISTLLILTLQVLLVRSAACRGERTYDVDVKFDGANPHGIAPPDSVRGVVTVPGPLVQKAIEDLTPEDRQWLAWRAQLDKKR